MNTIWLLAFTALLSNGQTLGSIAGSYDDPQGCTTAMRTIREPLKQHIEQLTELKVKKLDVFCVPHRFDE